MHTFLVPYDGSASALRALQHALNLAKELHETKLELLNVQEPALMREHASRTSQEIRHMQMEAAMRVLQPAVTLLDAENISYVTNWSSGSAADEILKLMKERHYAAIIMGTRGHGAIASAILGSVTAKVIHGATVPVTLVK